MSITYACPYHNPTTTMGHSIHNIDISKPLTHSTSYTLSANCPVQWKPGFIRDENTSQKGQTPSNVSICPLMSVTTMNCSQVETPMRTTSSRWASLRLFLTVYAEILWLCKPIVAAAVRGAGLRRSWRWRCWMWRSWAGVVTRGLRLWGWLDVLPNSLKRLWRRLMVENEHSIHGQQLWWTFLQSGCQLHAPSKFVTSVALCCVIKLHILEWSFIVASLRHTCAIIMLSNQNLDMPHLWGGWIISAKEKCSLTQI